MSVTLISAYNPTSNTTTFAVPTHQRGAIISKRDMLETQNSVKIFFPRNGMLPGGYQKMNVVGSYRNSAKIQVIASGIVQNAQTQYGEYKERQRARRSRMTSQFYTPTSALPATPERTVGIRFAGLEVDAPAPKQAWPVLSNKLPVKTKTPAWGPHLNHSTTPEPTVIVPVVLEGNWGDESDDE